MRDEHGEAVLATRNLVKGVVPRERDAVPELDNLKGFRAAAGAKDGVRGFHAVAVDGVSETGLHVGHKGQRTRCQWGVSESDWRRAWTDLDAVGQESSPEAWESHFEQVIQVCSFSEIR